MHVKKLVVKYFKTLLSHNFCSGSYKLNKNENKLEDVTNRFQKILDGWISYHVKPGYYYFETYVDAVDAVRPKYGGYPIEGGNIVN